jgi:hypothetical protein
LIISYILRLILSDVDFPFAQRTIGNTEAIEGDFVILLHVTLRKFILANVGAVPIDFSNQVIVFTVLSQADFERALSARGRIFSTTVTPFVLFLAFDLSPLGARGFIEPII